MKERNPQDISQSVSMRVERKKGWRGGGGRGEKISKGCFLGISKSLFSMAVNLKRKVLWWKETRL